MDDTAAMDWTAAPTDDKIATAATLLAHTTTTTSTTTSTTTAAATTTAPAFATATASVAAATPLNSKNPNESREKNPLAEQVRIPSDPFANEPAVAGPSRTEQSKHEVSVAELLELMSEYQPLMPDALNDYFLEKAGLYCPDVRIKRVIALAAQKFITEVAKDALHFSKIRQQQTTQARKQFKKEMLTMDDLSLALAEYGINVKKPEYYQ